MYMGNTHFLESFSRAVIGMSYLSLSEGIPVAILVILVTSINASKLLSPSIHIHFSRDKSKAQKSMEEE